VNAQEVAIFPTEGCKFPTEQIIDAQHFNYAHTFHKNKAFSDHCKFCIFKENFRTRKKYFSDRHFYWGEAFPSCLLPRHNATVPQSLNPNLDHNIYGYTRCCCI